MSEFNVFEQRKDNEIEFVSAALIGICQGVIDAEAVLAACPTHLIRMSHKAEGIYNAIAAISASHTNVNLVSVGQWLHGSKTYSDVTPADVAYFSGVSLFGNNVDSILKLAEVVRREGLKAHAEKELIHLLADCQRYGNDPAEIAMGAVRIAEGLEHCCADMADYSISRITARVLEKLESGIAQQPVKAPWPELNRILRGGFVPGELVVLAARPGIGKTALACYLAENVARNGKSVLFISREVKDEILAARMLSRTAHVDNRFFREGIVEAPNILPAIQQAQSKIAPLPLFIVERAVQSMTPRTVRRLAKGMHSIGLVIVDYLQLMHPDEKCYSREREVAEMSRAFKQLALDCDCPVLLISQLSRAAEQSDSTPQLSHLRESGAIEQDADIVMFLHTTDRSAVFESQMTIKVIVAKGRSSGTGAMWLKFNKPFAEFTETPAPCEKQTSCNKDNGL